MGGKGGKGSQKRADPDDAKGTRKRLAEITTELEKARVKRAKAQARVEALEALAEELAERLAADAVAASEEKGRVSADAQATEGPDASVGPADAPAPAARSRGKAARSPERPRPAQPAAPKPRKPRKPRPTAGPA